MGSSNSKLKFHHLHFYVASLQPLRYYKQLEDVLNRFADEIVAVSGEDSAFGGVGRGRSRLPDRAEVDRAREIWQKANAEVGGGTVKKGYEMVSDPEAYSTAGQDVVRQMLAGAGWRIKGVYDGPDTLSYHVGESEVIAMLLGTRMLGIMRSVLSSSGRGRSVVCFCFVRYTANDSV